MGKIKSIHENQYIISDNSAQHLLDLGFKYNNEEEKYVYNVIQDIVENIWLHYIMILMSQE